MHRQQRHILAPVAQRRQLDRDDVEPVVQVLAEALGRDFLGELLIGGRDHPDIHPQGLEPPEALKRPILQDP